MDSSTKGWYGDPCMLLLGEMGGGLYRAEVIVMADGYGAKLAKMICVCRFRTRK